MEIVLGVGGILFGLFAFYVVGRRVERDRCATIARMFQEERGAFIATAIESELLP